jgi:methionyl-tRNA formyltransferase
MPRFESLVFFGSPDFAVPTLAALVEAGRRPRLVVSQPARPAGRGRRPQDPAVAGWARRHGLPVEQPERVREPGFLERLRSLEPDLAVVVAFGQIFPRALLDLPRHGCVNVHASLLPRWRGASPIQAALAAGDRVTGVTTMAMEEGLDSGPILLQEEVEIGPEETAGELSERLAGLGARLLVETVEALEAGTVTPRPQPEEGVTYAPRLTRDSGRVDWRLPAPALVDRLRAYTPWPGLTAELRGEPLKIVRARALPDGAAEPPGSFLGPRNGALAVACGEGTALVLESVQRPGRKALAAADFANGERLRAGELFS